MKFLVFLFLIVGASCTKLLKLPNLNARILGGENAKPGEVPYQVSLQAHTGVHQCGGAIIDERWIVTSAFCTAGSTSSMKVLTGTNNIKSGGAFYNVEEFFPHPRYGRPKYYNNIGLIKLKNRIVFDNATKPIDYDYREIPENAVLAMSGWGWVDLGGDLPDILQILNTTYVEYDKCKEIRRGSKDLDCGHVCTMSRLGRGMCRADSGGPLTYQGKLVAIINYGMGCARGVPDVHARISYYHDFIRRTIILNDD